MNNLKLINYTKMNTADICKQVVDSGVVSFGNPADLNE